MRSFPRTSRALDAERPGLSIVGLGLVSLLFLAWLVWLFAARVSVFEVTPLGHLEVERAAYAIAPEVGGRVVEAPVTMGRTVEAGELLVRLDSGDLEIRLREERARRASIEGELEALRKELDLARRASEEVRRASELALREKRVQLRQAGIEAGLAREEAERLHTLLADGLVSEMDARRKGVESERLRESVESASVAVDLEEARLRSGELEGETGLARLLRQLAELEGEARSTALDMEQTRHEIEKRSVRAPRAGVVSEIVDLRLMSTVQEGEALGTILASGDIQVVADFAASSALGRIEPGQTAEVRLEAFPWTQYGALAATVDRVAGEPRGGRLRVELQLGPEGDARVRLRHGLTGTVEVEVERVSPAGLLLRTLGKALGPAHATPAADADARSARGEASPRSR
jgi:membrane fusion protein (multidrug efflux system)